MPRGIISPEALERRLEKRKQASIDRSLFLIKISDTLRVEKDKYNIILFQKKTTEKSANMYLYPLGYYSSFHSDVLINRARESGATQKDLESYKEKVKSFKVSHKDGRIIVDMPKDFVFDSRDPDEPDPEETDPESEESESTI